MMCLISSLNFLLFFLILEFGYSQIQILENCKDEICLKNEKHSLSKERESMLINKTFYNPFLNHSEAEILNKIETKFEVPHLITEIEALQYTPSLNDSNFNNNLDKNIQSTTDFLELVENVTESHFTINKISEQTHDYMSETKEIGNSTTQYITETTSKTVTVSNNDYSIFFNISDYKDICFCDLSLNECDINCCCDHECGPNHWRVFTQCDESYTNYQFYNCLQNNFMLKNNQKFKVIHVESGLLCISKNNLKTSKAFKNIGIITSLKNFYKTLPKNVYSFKFKTMSAYKFEIRNYKADSLVWTLQDGSIKPFAIPVPTIGSNCISETPVRYLNENIVVCSYYIQKNSNCGLESENFIKYVKDLIVIANPQYINKSLNYESVKVCQSKVCILTDIYLCKEYQNCSKILSNRTETQPKIYCSEVISRILYQIWHNGSEGIRKFEIFIFTKQLSSRNLNLLNYLRTTEVKFLWLTSPKKPGLFKKSGNPGYLTGKPIITTKKNSSENVTGVKKEVMELPLEVSDRWLGVVGSDNGFCALQKRIPIGFRENSHHSCLIKLTKDDFGKKNCFQLQKKILTLLLGNDLTNVTSETFFNKFVATFGNSKSENAEDWVHVLIDLFPVSSNQVDFKFGLDFLSCRNIISDLIIEIAYSNVGSFLNPQAKILGVFFQFGKHKNVEYYCDNFQCENSTREQFFKLSSTVNFFDLTKPAVDIFAEPLGLEVKLPHDFFYPFFSKAPPPRSLNKFVSGLFFLTLLNIK